MEVALYRYKDACLSEVKRCPPQLPFCVLVSDSSAWRLPLPLGVEGGFSGNGYGWRRLTPGLLLASLASLKWLIV